MLNMSLLNVNMYVGAEEDNKVSSHFIRAERVTKFDRDIYQDLMRNMCLLNVNMYMGGE